MRRITTKKIEITYDNPKEKEKALKIILFTAEEERKEGAQRIQIYDDDEGVIILNTEEKNLIEPNT